MKNFVNILILFNLVIILYLGTRCFLFSQDRESFDIPIGNSYDGHLHHVQDGCDDDNTDDFLCGTIISQPS